MQDLIRLPIYVAGDHGRREMDVPWEHGQCTRSMEIYSNYPSPLVHLYRMGLVFHGVPPNAMDEILATARRERVKFLDVCRDVVPAGHWVAQTILMEVFSDSEPPTTAASPWGYRLRGRDLPAEDEHSEDAALLAKLYMTAACCENEHHLGYFFWAAGLGS